LNWPILLPNKGLRGFIADLGNPDAFAIIERKINAVSQLASRSFYMLALQRSQEFEHPNDNRDPADG